MLLLPTCAFDHPGYHRDAVRRRGLTSGNIEKLATGLGQVHSLVVTSDALYWTVQHAAAAKVQGLAKP